MTFQNGGGERIRLPNQPLKRVESRIRVNQDAVISGNLEEAERVGKKALKMFISSTFTDTKAERNHLTADICPRMRLFCDARDIDFSVVDFRWGIRDSATNDHMTTEICMNEIDKCYRDSIDAPCFVFLSFNRYGWTPLPRTIEVAEMAAILDGIVDENDLDLVNKWYLKDTNAIPPVYVLQPISTEFPELLTPDGKSILMTLFALIGIFIT